MSRLLALACSIFVCCYISGNVRADGKPARLGGPANGGGGALGRCCVADTPAAPGFCAVTTQGECNGYGGAVSWTTGLTCDTPCAPIGACCSPLLDNVLSCTETTRAGCEQIQGSYIGDGTHCNSEPLPCSQLLGRCCFSGIVADPPLCEVTNWVTCLAHPGYLSWTAGANCSTGCPLPPTGACCSDLLANPLGCIVTTRQQCLAMSGNYLGDGTLCIVNGTSACAAAAGRCCFVGQNATQVFCEMKTQAVCLALPGYRSWTAGLTCNTPCENPTAGACCVPMNIPGAAYCVEWTRDQCDSVGGDYHGDGSTCAAIGECPLLGRCCFVGIIFPPFLCDVTTQAACANYPGGTWTAGLTCDWPCESHQGACCLANNPGTTSCIMTTPDHCQQIGGVYRGDNSQCGPNGQCPPIVTGACCFANNPGTTTCIMTTPDHCQQIGGVYRGDNSQCGPNGQCPPSVTGACCLITPIPEGVCIQVTHESCIAQGGTYHGDHSTCPANGACMFPTGACCIPTAIPEGVCIQTTHPACDAQNGAYHGDNSICPDNGSCMFATGACCLPAPGTVAYVCQIMTRDACLSHGGTYFGDYSTCPPAGSLCQPNGAGACCLDIDDGPIAYDTCLNRTAAQCAEMGGVFHGANTVCQSAGCCFPTGLCQDMDPRCCAASGGTPRNAPCATAPCQNDPTGACCLTPNVPGTTSCIVTTHNQCDLIGGQYRGDGTNCQNVDLCPPLGRCCFVGIVADPILCDVTTREACLAYAGFISWTAHLTCDAPCEPTGGDVFAGCGTLGPGPQGCVLFHADSGETFALEHAGPVLANRVFVRGIVEPHSFLCFPIIMPALLNNTISICLNDCGVLVSGAECVLFQSDAGGLYVIQNHGGFHVGDRVRVAGGLNPTCVTICQQGNGCIEDNTIEPCDNTPPVGACCYALVASAGTCFMATAEQCAVVGGQYQGDGTACSPDLSCPNQLGRCCFLGFNPNEPICQMLTRQDCMNLPAPISWNGALTCETPCIIEPPHGACCGTPVANPLGCIELTASRCLELGGIYHGDGSTCYPVNPCAAQLGRCCFLGFNPQTPICDVTTLAQCYSMPAPLSWTPGINCDLPCPLACEPGDANGDGTVDGRDIPGFVRSLLGDPASGDRADCCNLGAPTMTDEVMTFVQHLTGS